MNTKFNPGDRVITIENGEIRRGTVAKIFPPLTVIAVEFEDGKIEKIDIDTVALDLTPKPADEDPKEQPNKNEVEDKTITISETEFRDISVKLAIKLAGDNNPIIGMTFTIFCTELANKLFPKD